MAPWLKPAARPTMYFIGVTTSRSSIMKVFPRWAAALGTEAVLEGIDLPIHADPAQYREVVDFIKRDPLSLGALVTTHKIDLLAAARPLFDALCPYAQLLGEVSSLSKREGKLWGHAKDPISSGLALEAFLPVGWWEQTGGHALCLGAGGSALAISVYLTDPRHGPNRPARLVVTNRSLPRLEQMRRIHAQLGHGVPCEYHPCSTLTDNDRALERLPPCALVINATGLGKDRPGSPITDGAEFPRNGLAWDFNYRGDLRFLVQARRQQQAKCLVVEDGWVYFIHGWLQVIAEVLHVAIGPAEVARLSRIAEQARAEP